MDKNKVRKEMSAKRQALSKEEVTAASIHISDLLIASTLYKDASNICVYQAFRNEVSCETIMKQAFLDGKQIFVPVTDLQSKTMDFYQVMENTEWKTGSYGILEPVISKDNKKLQEPALILMPGLVFDKNKRRIGYGGGYYDKYLAVNKNHITIALCYDFQVVDYALPFEEHDILPDYILTNNNLI